MLFLETDKGKSPSIKSTLDMDRAKALYEYLVEKCKQSNCVIGKGGGRESMLVDLKMTDP